MRDLARLRGLLSLLADAVEHGSRAVEEVHSSSSARAFGVIELVPSTREHVRAVRAVHDAGVALTYGGVRLVTRVVRASFTVGLDVAEAVAPTSRDDR